MNDHSHAAAASALPVPVGSAVGALIQDFDWSRTPLGPIAHWPACLRSTVATMLHSRQPMFLFWGRENIQLYNDAYVPSFGDGQHPAALGQRGQDCWPEIWPVLGAEIEAAWTTLHATWHDNARMQVRRGGRLDTVCWTYGLSPVFDEHGQVRGALVTCIEITARVLLARRQAVLQKLARELGDAQTMVEIAQRSMAIARAAEDDFAQASLCELAPDGERWQPFLGDDAASFAAIEPELARRVPPGSVERAASVLSQRPEDPDAYSIAHYRPEGPQAPGDHLVITPVARPPNVRHKLMVLAIQPGLAWDGAFQEFCDQFFTLLIAALVRVEAATVRESSRRVVEEALAQRQQLVDELRGASQAKDEFLAMLGHELRNPLSPIVSALHLMRLRGDSATAREQDVIARQVDHMVRLVDDLLDVARITRGMVELRRERIELSRVLHKAVEMARPLFEGRRQRLHVEVPGHGLACWVDPIRLAQVVANLLTNASRYTPPGGNVWLSAFAVRRDDGQDAAITVRDDGNGLAPELLPRVFELFVQGGRSFERSEGGLGLGLALVKSLVTLHGGEVWAHSEGPGKGSTFSVLLPIADALPDAAGVADAEAAPAAPPQGQRILLVDDNRDAAESLAELLRMRGHQVLLAHDPAAALERAAAFEPSVAVLDIGLPGMDGYELGRRLGSSPGLESCRFFALTGYGQDSDRARSAQAGFEAHLVKPVDLRQLQDLIERRKAPRPPVP